MRTDPHAPGPHRDWRAPTKITLSVEIELEHVTGLFVSRAAAALVLVDGIEGAAPGGRCVDDSQCRVASMVASPALS